MLEILLQGKEYFYLLLGSKWLGQFQSEKIQVKVVSMELFYWVKVLVIKEPLKKSQLVVLQTDQLVITATLIIN